APAKAFSTRRAAAAASMRAAGPSPSADNSAVSSTGSSLCSAMFVAFAKVMLAQSLHAQAQPALGRIEAHAELLRQFRDAHADDMVQDQGLPLRIGQAVEYLSQLAPRRVVVGVAEDRMQRAQLGLGAVLMIALALLAAELAQHRANSDAVGPGRE